MKYQLNDLENKTKSNIYSAYAKKVNLFDWGEYFLNQTQFQSLTILSIAMLQFSTVHGGYINNFNQS